MSSAYFERLKDPRWQKRRLEMLAAAKWQCQKCGNPFETLHVHHKAYQRGRLPWEYTDAELIVICESCHTAAHDEEGTQGDADLETRIERAREALNTAPPDEKKIAWAALASLLAERSPQKVKEMEFSRGLTRQQQRQGAR